MATIARCSILSIVALIVLCSCGDYQARIGLRNAAVAAKALQSHEDEKVQAAGHAIEAQVTAAADQADERFWGLYVDKSRATIQLDDWEESWNSALRRSMLQAEAIRQETEDNRRIQAASMGLLNTIGLTFGTGTLGAAALWLLRNRKMLMDGLQTSVAYGNEVAPATTPEEVNRIKDKYKALANPALKAAVAKAKEQSKVS